MSQSSISYLRACAHTRTECFSQNMGGVRKTLTTLTQLIEQYKSSLNSIDYRHIEKLTNREHKTNLLPFQNLLKSEHWRNKKSNKNNDVTFSVSSCYLLKLTHQTRMVTGLEACINRLLALLAFCAPHPPVLTVRG